MDRNGAALSTLARGGGQQRPGLGPDMLQEAQAAGPKGCGHLGQHSPKEWPWGQGTTGTSSRAVWDPS